MLLKKDFEGDLRAILIQDEHRRRKIDSRSQCRRFDCCARVARSRLFQQHRSDSDLSRCSQHVCFAADSGHKRDVAALPLRADFVAKVAAQVTILFDAFGKTSDLKRGWGYSASIEYAGRRILFDTGSKGSDFAYNANAIGVDLKQLDFVVLSHRHNDHTAGLNHVL